MILVKGTEEGESVEKEEVVKNYKENLVCAPTVCVCVLIECNFLLASNITLKPAFVLLFPSQHSTTSYIGALRPSAK